MEAEKIAVTLEERLRERKEYKILLGCWREKLKDEEKMNGSIMKEPNMRARK